jgi:hypothetical protein
MIGRCGTQFGPSDRFSLELDHVNTSGLGKRGPSIPENLVSLCGLHHRMKTEQSRVWRPMLNENFIIPSRRTSGVDMTMGGAVE